MEKYQVIFFDDYEDGGTPYTEQYFDSKIEAEKWAEGQEFDEQDIKYNPETMDDEFYTKYSYHNPQDKQNYPGYSIELVKNNELNEDYIRIQKLAGLISESEYNYQKAQLWYKNYVEGVKKSLNNLKNTVKNEGYDV